VLAYLGRYTHRVAIANSRLIACDRNGVTFRWKDYRAEGRDRQKVMTLATAEFIRRFLTHVLRRSVCSPKLDVLYPINRRNCPPRQLTTQIAAHQKLRTLLGVDKCLSTVNLLNNSFRRFWSYTQEGCTRRVFR
jgi:hypothetical protein